MAEFFLGMVYGSALTIAISGMIALYRALKDIRANGDD